MARGHRNRFFNPHMSEGFGVVTVFVNNGAVVVMSIFFEMNKPSEGLGWTPSYNVTSLEKIKLGLALAIVTHHMF